MKYLKLSLVIAIAAISFSACKKDKDKTSIIGTWNATMMVSSAEMNGVPMYADTMTISGDNYMRITFMADNKTKAESNMGEVTNETGYYSISGSQLVLGDSADDPEKETFNFQLSGSKLTLSKEQTETTGGGTVKAKMTIHLTR